MDGILKLLEKDARFTSQQIAAMLGKDQPDVEATIAKYEANNIILGYSAIVDWDKMKDETVTALIEVKIAPQRGDGFERIAERIYQYEEVDSLYLMSGAFDFTVILTGRSIKEVSQFVFARLAPIEGVTGTATHFILKKYKEKGRVFSASEDQEERLMFV